MNPLKLGIVYRTYDLIRSYVEYRKIRKFIKDVLYGDDFKMVIKTYLNIDVDKDWLGRLYGVINPNIDINGNFNINNVIIEIDGDDTNTDEYVKNWLYRQLNLMGQLYKMKPLYSHVTLEFEHVGPIEYDNYLIVFDIVERIEFAASFKRFIKTFGVYAVLAGIILFFI